MSKMEESTDSGSATRPETTNPHNAKGLADGLNGGDNGKPVLSLVSEAHSASSHVEDGFFAKGADDDKAALEMYAAMLPRGFSWKRINPRYLLIAGGTALFLIGVATGRLLPRGSYVHAAPADETSATAAPIAAAPAPAPVAAPTAPAPAPAAIDPAVPNPTPLAAAPTTPAPADPTVAVPAVAPMVALPPPPSEPVADKQEPAPTPMPAVAAAPTERPNAAPEKPAIAPIVAAPAPEPTAAAQPAAQDTEPVAKTVGPTAKPAEPAAKQAEPTPAEPTAGAAQAQNVQGCREALKKRDLKAVGANCESALAADTSLAKPLLAFAKGQFEKGKSAQAAVWARKIVQVNNSLADAYLIMGAAEQEARHAAAAKTAYQRYLELAPKGPYAEDVRSSLKSL